MRLIKKIPALTNNIHLDKNKLYYTDLDKKVVCMDLEKYSILWEGKPNRFYVKFSDDFIFNEWEYQKDNDDIYLTTVINKNDFTKQNDMNFTIRKKFKNNQMFIDFFNDEIDEKYGLFDFDNNSIVWQDNKRLHYSAKVINNNVYTLKDLRLEMIEAMTGKLMWSVSTEIKKRVYYNPQNIIDVVGDELLMTYNYKEIVGISLRNGEIVWRWNIDGIVEGVPDFEFTYDEYPFVLYDGRYYFGNEYKLYSMDINKREITIESEAEIEFRGKMRKMNYAKTFLFGNKIVFYGDQYSKKLGAYYSVIGVYDLEKKKVVDFADDEFPGPLRFKPQIYENKLFQQDDHGNIHVFELELEE